MIRLYKVISRGVESRVVYTDAVKVTTNSVWIYQEDLDGNEIPATKTPRVNGNHQYVDTKEEAADTLIEVIRVERERIQKELKELARIDNQIRTLIPTDYSKTKKTPRTDC